MDESNYDIYGNNESSKSIIKSIFENEDNNNN